MSEALRQYYLNQLGIRPWVLRTEDILEAKCDLQVLADTVSSCTLCPLHKTRTQSVFARGNAEAKLMIVGEAPGFYEDKQGLPFVGKAGGLLNRMLQSIGFMEDDVYIANVLKCRPPDNRDPEVEEIKQCSGYLAQQISAIKPSLIVAVGRFAGQFLLGEQLPLNKMREKLHSYQAIPVLVSYHPAYLLRNPKDKGKAYQDLLRAKEIMSSLR